MGPRKNQLIACKCLLAFALAAIASSLGLSQSAERTVNFWAVTGGVTDARMFDRLATDFKKESGISVRVTPLSWGNFATKYFTSMAANLPPDIGVTNLGGPMDYGSVGGLVDLKKEFPGEIDQLLDQFYPKMIPQFTFKGQLFGLPTEATTLVIYYRTDVFQRLNITPPKTWSELNETIRKLEAAGYHYYFGFTKGAQWAIGLYTMPYNLPEFVQDGSNITVNWNELNFQRGVFEGLSLWHMHDSPGSDIGSRVVGLFKSDDVKIAMPMVIDLPNTYTSLQKTAPEIAGKWDIIPWPKADDGKAYSVMGGTSYVIFRKSKHKKEAFEWLKYLNRVDVQQKMILDRLDRGDESAFTVSPVKGIWTEESTEFWKKPLLADSLRLKEAMGEIVRTFDTRPPIHGTSEAGQLESNMLDRMGTFITDSLSDLAQKHGLSRWELIRAFANGKFADERTVLDSQIKAKIKSEYVAIQPQALEMLQRETKFYDDRYGNVIARLDTYEHQPTVLTYVEWTASIFIVGLFALVLGRRQYRKHIVSYMFIAPPILLSIVFVFIPAVTALYLSFTEYHPVLPLSSATWEGVRNYVEVWKSGDLTNSVWRTLLYVVGTLPIGIAIALLLAVLLNNKLVGQRYWRFLYFSPMVTSVVSISLIFVQLFLGSSLGWLNGALLKVGLIRDPVQFLHNERAFLWCVILLAVWHGLAFNILVFLAGLQQVPTQLYEAAEVDGAGSMRKFWNISLPGIRPQVMFISILGVIGAFQVFETIFMVGCCAGEAGAMFGPNNSGMTMVPLVYHTGFETFKMGSSSAIAYVLFAIILVITVIQLRVFREKGSEISA